MRDGAALIQNGGHTIHRRSRQTFLGDPALLETVDFVISLLDVGLLEMLSDESVECPEPFRHDRATGQIVPGGDSQPDGGLRPEPDLAAQRYVLARWLNASFGLVCQDGLTVIHANPADAACLGSSHVAFDELKRPVLGQLFVAGGRAGTAEEAAQVRRPVLDRRQA